MITLKLIVIACLIWFIYLHVRQQNKIVFMSNTTDVSKRVQNTFLVVNSLGIVGVIIITIIVATL